MAKVKSTKKSTRVDMTAMCDVAFLLLSFFIMSSTARLPEPYPVDTPMSTVQSKMPDSDLATITIGEESIFFGVTGQDVRALMLEKMAEKYKMTFTPQEYAEFSLMEFFGVDVRAMHELLKIKGTDRATKGLQPGIPMDSTSTQLYDWIYFARIAAKTIDSKVDLAVAIKGDKNMEYPRIKQVIDILQEQKKNNFFLVTGLRGKDY